VAGSGTWPPDEATWAGIAAQLGRTGVAASGYSARRRYQHLLLARQGPAPALLAPLRLALGSLYGGMAQPEVDAVVELLGGGAGGQQQGGARRSAAAASTLAALQQELAQLIAAVSEGGGGSAKGADAAGAALLSQLERQQALQMAGTVAGRGLLPLGVVVKPEAQQQQQQQQASGSGGGPGAAVLANGATVVAGAGTQQQQQRPAG
jgi:hypothetical protein